MGFLNARARAAENEELYEQRSTPAVEASTCALRRMNVLLLDSAREEPGAGILDTEFQLEERCRAASAVIHTCISTNNRQSAHGWLFEAGEPDLDRDRPVAELAVSSNGDVAVIPGCPPDYDELKARLLPVPETASAASARAAAMETAPADAATAAPPPPPPTRSRTPVVVMTLGVVLTLASIALMFVGRNRGAEGSHAPAAVEASAPPKPPVAAARQAEPVIPPVASRAEEELPPAAEPERSGPAARSLEEPPRLAARESVSKPARPAAKQRAESRRTQPVQKPTTSLAQPTQAQPLQAPARQVAQPVQSQPAQAPAHVAQPVQPQPIETRPRQLAQAPALQAPAAQTPAAQTPAAQTPAAQAPAPRPAPAPVAQPAPPPTVAAQTPPPQKVEPSVGRTVEPAPVTIEGASGTPLPAIEQPRQVRPQPMRLAENSRQRLVREQQRQCERGLQIQRQICRERVLWNHCHPDKWNTLPECRVQQLPSPGAPP